MLLALEDVQEIRFTVVKGSNPGSKLAFEPTARTIRIGRSVDNDIVIADPTVSRQHARVEIQKDGYAIADNGSSSGLEKMGFRVGRELEPLNSGDEFRLGDTILRFEIVAKKGAMKRVAAQAAGAPPPGPSPITNVVATFRRALATMGLRNPVTQAVGGACFLILAVIGLWPEPPTIGEQSYAPLPIDYNAVWGTAAGDQSHADGATFEIPSDAEGVGVYLRVLPGGGVEMRAGGQILARIERGRDWVTYHVVALPSAVARDGESRLVLDHLGYAIEQGPVPPEAVPGWGVGRMRIVRVPNAASSPARLEEDVSALREMYGRVDDNPRFRYDLVMGLRRALVGLMKLAGRAAVAYDLPSTTGVVGFDVQIEGALVEIRERRLDRAVDRFLPALQIADVELNREHRKLANSLEVLKKKNSTAEIATILPRILKLIPDPTDVRHRDALDVSRTLKGKDLEAFKELMDQP